MRLKRNLQRLFCACFFLILAIPVWGLLQPPQEELFFRYELRTPASWPAGKWHKEKFQGFEKWFGDRFLGRWELTGAWSRLLYYGLGASAQPDRLLVGRDGWIFLGNTWARTVEQYRGLAEPAQEELRQKAQYLQELQYLCAAQQVPFLVVLAPDKHTVYPEYMPAWAGAAHASRLQGLTQELQSRGVPVLNLLKTELAAKKRYGVVYGQGDSHWNALGAYAAYEELARCLQEDLGVPVRRYAAAEMTITPWLRRGENGLSNMLQLDAYEGTDARLSHPDFAPSMRVIEANGETHRWPANKEIVNRLVQKAPLRLVNDQAQNDTKVLLLRDSFSIALAPYLQQSVREIVHLHYAGVLHSRPRYPFGKLVQEHRPQAVVLEMAERELLQPLPDDE